MKEPAGQRRMNNKFCIMVEKGNEHYETTKMQGAGIRMYICESKDLSAKIKRIKTMREVSNTATVYVIGSTIFCDNVKRYFISNQSLDKYQIEVSSHEDDVMSTNNISFIKEAEVKVKQSAPQIRRKVEIEGSDLFKDSGFTEDEIQAVLMAIDELKTKKIFPETLESIHDSFVNIIDMYLFDKDDKKAEELAFYCLKKIAENSEKNDKIQS